MDFSQLSDEELEQIAQGESAPQRAPQSDIDMSGYSDEDLQRLASGQEPNFLQKAGNRALEGVIWAGEKIDSYTGAPTRAAISAVQNDRDPMAAFAWQFGEDPKNAPTGKDIALKAGASDDAENSTYDKYLKPAVEGIKSNPIMGPVARVVDAVYDRASDADMAGFGIDVAADPLWAVPGGQAATAVRNAGKGAKVAGRVTNTAVRKIPGVGSTLDLVGDSAKNTSRAINKMFSPRQADDFKDLVKIAEKNGIDPKMLNESVEFGENSFLSRASRHRAESVTGEKYLQKHQEGINAIREATQKKVAQIGGGSIPSKVEAGETLREGFDKGVDAFFKSHDVTHNRLVQAVPGAQISPEGLSKINSKLNGMEKWAKGRTQRGFTNAQRAQGEQILRAIDAVKRGNGSYKQTVEALRDIGDVAFKTVHTAADVPPDVKKFRELYFTIDEALIDTAGKLAGKPVAQELRATNKAISKFLTDKSVVAKTVMNKRIAPEKAFQSLVVNGDTKTIASLKRILPEREFKQLKGAFVESLIKRNVDGEFSFKAVHNALRNKKNVLGVLFEADEIREIDELIRLGSRYGDPVLSYSGTGASNTFRDITSGLRSGIENDAVIDFVKKRARDNSTGKLINVKPKSVKKTNSTLKKLRSISPIAARVVSTSNSSGDQPKTLKGKNKWSVDGFGNMRDHDSKGLMNNPKFVEKLFSTKKGRDLLIEASSAEPGSARMESLFRKLKKLNEKSKDGK